MELTPTTLPPWWLTDDYTWDLAKPPMFDSLAGPNGIALVRAWPDGKTDPGWGLQGPKHDPENGFMPRYLKDQFNTRKILFGYEHDKWAFAYIMRSLRVVCVDIDGKNGGFEHAKKLGALTPTLAETSKSGNGYHLFYEVDDTWDVDKGYDSYADHIGIEQGVDIRSTGCVYHHKQQRWNGRNLAPLPTQLQELMLAKRQRQVASTTRIAAVIAEGDEMEMLMLKDELIGDLKKPIPDGKRNTTLFAIGQKLKEAGVEDWPELIADRAVQVGLDTDEVEKLVANIERYN